MPKKTMPKTGSRKKSISKKKSVDAKKLPKLTKKLLVWQSEPEVDGGTYFIQKIYHIPNDRARICHFVMEFQHSIYKRTKFFKELKSGDTRNKDFNFDENLNIIKKEAARIAKLEYAARIQAHEKTKNFTAEQLCKILEYNFKKNNMLNSIPKKYLYTRYKKHFDKEYVASEAKLAIAFAVQAWRQYHKLTNQKLINMKDDTNLSTIGLLKGYCSNALTNNVRKKKTKLSRIKRSSYNSMESLNDTFGQDTDNMKIDFLVSSNKTEDYLNFSHLSMTIKAMFKTLLKEDQKADRKYKLKYETTFIPENKKSRLADLFRTYLKEEHKGKITSIAEDMGLSEHLVKKLREKMSHILSNEFADEGEDLIRYLKEQSTRINGASDKDKSLLLDKKESGHERYKIFQAFEMIPKNGKIKIAYVTNITEYQDGIWACRKQYKQQKVILDSPDLIDKTKLSLKDLGTQDLVKAEKFLPKLAERDKVEEDAA